MNKLYVAKSGINGKGLFTSIALRKGQTIDYIHGPIHSFRVITPSISRKIVNWIGVGRRSWIDTSSSPFFYINHSCSPNAAHVTRRKVIALRDIPAHTELTLDYSLTEAESGWGIDRCSCGTSACRKKVGPIYSLPPSIFNAKRHIIPDNFRYIYKVEQKNYSHQ